MREILISKYIFLSTFEWNDGKGTMTTITFPSLLFILPKHI